MYIYMFIYVREIYFKELVHAIAWAGLLETEAGFHCYGFKAEFSFSRKFQLLCGYCRQLIRRGPPMLFL